MSTHLVPIFTQTVGSGGATSITFNNIPQGYTDLVIQYSLRSNYSGGFADGNAILLNNSYALGSWTQVYSTGSGLGTNAVTNAGYIGVINATGTTANMFSNGTITIPNYTWGNYKSVNVDVVNENNSASTVGHIIGNTFRINAPVTSVSLTCGQGSFVQYSTATLYGVANQFAAQTPVAPTITSVVDQAGFASVNFLPTAPDNATVYAVTDNNNNTTYGAGSPIVASVTLGSNTTFTAKAINALATTSAAGTASITSSNNYASIATQAITSNTSSVTFSNIPQNYTHLQIRAFARGSSAQTSGYSYISYNGSSTGTSHYLMGNGSTLTSGQYLSSAQPLTFHFPCASASANVFGVALVDILDYANTSKNKVTRVLDGWDASGNGTVSMWTHSFPNTAPISSITISAWDLANFVQYSHFALYGIV